ncbi:MAG: hypothetical protein NZ898_02930 [Myxococcota bacterium]|nr:hypothetical protein [Myxococcota bacterium]
MSLLSWLPVACAQGGSGRRDAGPAHESGLTDVDDVPDASEEPRVGLDAEVEGSPDAPSHDVPVESTGAEDARDDDGAPLGLDGGGDGSRDAGIDGGSDGGPDAGVDGGGIDAPAVPAITSVEPRVLAHGARIVLRGSGLSGPTGVTVGGVAQSFSTISDGEIVLAGIDDATPLGPQTIVVGTSRGPASAEATVVRLLVNEVDANTPGEDREEYVELATGVPGVRMEGYVLVLFNGASDTIYASYDVSGMANDTGLLLVARSGFVPAPQIAFSGSTDQVQNGPDAVAVYRGSTATHPVRGTLTAVDLIDAVVYGDSADPALVGALLLPGAAAVHVVEGTATTAPMRSMSRCGSARRDGRVWMSGARTPGAPNVCP